MLSTVKQYNYMVLDNAVDTVMYNTVTKKKVQNSTL